MRLAAFLLFSTALFAADRQLVFSDDFHGNTIDTSKWNVVNAPGNAAQKIEGCYANEGVRVSDGSLHLVAERVDFKDRKTGKPCSFRSGRVESKFAFQYGRLEFRAKLPRGRGYWPALWVRTRPADGPIADEIDVIEGFGSRPGAVQSTLHLWDNGKRLKQWCGIVGVPSFKKHCAASPQVLPPGTDFSAGFHDWAVDWAPHKVTWYLDGKEFYSTSDYSPTRPMVIVMNLAVGGSFDGAVDATTPFPMEMAIDWVRVYRDPTPAASAANRCRDLAKLRIPQAEFTLAQEHPAGDFTPPGGKPIPGVPAFCRVAATLRPTNDSAVRVELWLPEQWNKRFLGTGNGGYAGGISYGALVGGVRGNSASANTDMGLAVPPGKDAGVFAGHPERWKDWGHRATHEMTAFSKRVIAAYYGEAAAKSYFAGCSTGGQQALMEAQRHPDDYDGIVAGAAANYRTRLHMAILWTFAAGTGLPAEKTTLLANAAVAACGAGRMWIDDPRQCKFDPASLQCHGAPGANCLTASEVEAARKIYRGPVNPRTGEHIYPGVPVGSEFAWARYYMKGGPQEKAPFQALFEWTFGNEWKWSQFDWDHDVAKVDAKLAAELNAVDADLSAFRARGHKLISYHGWADSLVMPGEALRYYGAVVNHFHSLDTTRGFYRLYMVPGLGHCSGGPGPNQFDMVAPLVEWVEHGIAPERVIATKYVEDNRNKGVEASRPLCPYPQVARYNGHGDAAKAESYTCAGPLKQ